MGIWGTYQQGRTRVPTVVSNIKSLYGIIRWLPSLKIGHRFTEITSHIPIGPKSRMDQISIGSDLERCLGDAKIVKHSDIMTATLLREVQPRLSGHAYATHNMRSYEPIFSSNNRASLAHTALPYSYSHQKNW